MAFRFPHPIQPQAPRRTSDKAALRRIGRSLAQLDEGVITRGRAIEEVRRAYLDSVR